MPYIPHTETEIEEMLKSAGADSIEELLTCLPAALRVEGRLKLPEGLTEQALKETLAGLAAKNRGSSEQSVFLGAGAYAHYIPSAVDHIISRSEFFTAYTPYQPELSQGTLQAVFEYQSFVARLTGMDVANASLYDGASAVAEAVLMAGRITKRPGVLVSRALHPEYREVTETYLNATPEDIHEIPYCPDSGTTFVDAIETALGESIGSVVIQNPNFFGSIEELARIATVVHANGSLLIVVVNEPVSLGILKSPGEAGADIVVGENQSFGNALNYGGPYLGFMACREKFLRQMPGRLVGETVDTEGRRAFCLTFATREQHIRRERATSNICTNHGLTALAASVHMALLGPSGLVELAELNLSKAAYLRDKLNEIEGVSVAFNSPVFNEFVLFTDAEPDAVLKALGKRGIVGGLSLSRFYPELHGHLLVTATEVNSKADMDAFAVALSSIVEAEAATAGE
ncbi:MAG: aminomethyl-transferring glycine dehydrogenase subunit GcvPA [Proteobacteria bacterium]|nr:aminomethyl-transferring glycine dehydrogenase subunit GcvPA [Pseudomonadota bacterium]